jgi:hypothetical protein
VTYRYRKQEPGQKYAPALPPAVYFKRSVLGEFMVCVIGSLWLIDHPLDSAPNLPSV